MSRARRLGAALALAAALFAGAANAAGLQLPLRERHVLKNGLTVVVMPTHRLPLVELVLATRAGSVYDPPGREGLAGLTAALLTQGAGVRDAHAIADAIAFVGGSLAAEAGAEQLTVSCEVLARDLPTGIELFRDVIVDPTFPEAEFERKREQALGQIAADLDDPQLLADKAQRPFLLGASPLAHPVLGWDRSVRALSRQDVAAFHRDRVVPENSVLVVVGDVEAKAVRAMLERAFAGWKRGGRRDAPPYAPVARTGGRRVGIVSKPEVTQAQIRMLCPGVARNHPDRDAILVANTILGGGFTSRLVNEVRVVRGLTYSIGSRFTTHRNAGTFGISTFTRNDSLRACVDVVLGVLADLVSRGPSEDELAKAKRYLTGQFPLGLQAPADLAGRLLDIELYGLPADELETFGARVEAVTMADVRRALKSYFCVDDLRILVVCDPILATRALEGLGPLETVALP